MIDNSNQKNSPQDFQVTTYIIQPKIFAELNLESIKKLHPFLGLGYTFVDFQFSDSNNEMDVSVNSENLSGFGLNLGVAYDITNKLFAQVQYDFTKIGVDNEVPDIKYNSNINILKIGLGYRL